MQVLYNSESYAVLQIGLPEESAPEQGTPRSAHERRSSGFEIVDKTARKGIFLQGALADRFRRGVEDLVAQGPDAEALDEYIGRYTELAQQPLVLH